MLQRTSLSSPLVNFLSETSTALVLLSFPALCWKQLKADTVYLTCRSRVLPISTRIAQKPRWQEPEVASYFPYTVKSTVQWINACLLVQLSSNPILTDCRPQTQWLVLPTVGRSSHLSYYHQDGFPTGVLTGQLGLDNSFRRVTALVILDCVTLTFRTTDHHCVLLPATFLLLWESTMAQSDWRKKGFVLAYGSRARVCHVRGVMATTW